MAKNKKEKKSAISDEQAKNLYTMTAPSQAESNSKKDSTTVDTAKS